MTTPPGPLYAFLQEDHAELDELLQRADATPALDLAAYESFRRGLLRHIAMEEKVLLPEARRLRGGDPLPIAKRLRADHAALAALLVPTPTHEILATIRTILIEHNPLEEDPGGLYELCEQLAGADLGALVERVKNTPEVPVATHFDGPRAQAGIERLLIARSALRDSR
ncbi:MAG TPA: hemerythrin domain-containing protein [Polyangiales bacterium]|nr:hemerythrin domain-containing protein [Polyangiales bacterium]